MQKILNNKFMLQLSPSKKLLPFPTYFLYLCHALHDREKTIAFNTDKNNAICRMKK